MTDPRAQPPARLHVALRLYYRQCDLARQHLQFLEEVKVQEESNISRAQGMNLRKKSAQD
jgi:hypothetical protein